MGNFSAQEQYVIITDLADSQHKRIIQTLVDNGIFALEDGNFNPQRTVTTAEILAALEKL